MISHLWSSVSAFFINFASCAAAALAALSASFLRFFSSWVRDVKGYVHCDDEESYHDLGYQLFRSLAPWNSPYFPYQLPSPRLFFAFFLYSAEKLHTNMCHIIIYPFIGRIRIQSQSFFTHRSTPVSQRSQDCCHICSPPPPPPPATP